MYLQASRLPARVDAEGVLLKTDRGWQIADDGGGRAEADGFVVDAGGAPVPLARRSGGQWQIDAAAAAQAVDGQLVFIGSLPGPR